MSDDKFTSITEPSLGMYKDKGSKFNAYLLPCKSEESFRAQLELVKANEPNARHYCWAFRIDPEEIYERSNDDGEPANTAGAPILRALQSAQLVNVACVVVRYFGGIKLGVPGLISAYGGATKEAIHSNTLVTEVITRDIALHFDYSELSFVERVSRELNLTTVERIQEARLRYVVRVEKSKLEETLQHFEKNHLLRVSAL